MHVFIFFSQLVFFKAVTGLLGRPAAFHGVGFISSVELPIGLLSPAAIFFGEGGFFSGPVTGLLGGPAVYLEVVVFCIGLLVEQNPPSQKTWQLETTSKWEALLKKSHSMKSSRPTKQASDRP